VPEENMEVKGTSVLKMCELGDGLSPLSIGSSIPIIIPFEGKKK